jgi:Transglycosylase SLT domain
MSPVAATRYLKFIICAAGLTIAQTYFDGASYGKSTSAASSARKASVDYAASASALCRAAVEAAANRWGIPRGLLLAIAKVETGRRIAGSGTAEPWPWSANAENRALFFATRIDAVDWTKQAMLRGVASIDSGCLQVNLQQHPHAFASVEDAFNPARNADYAARFLRFLYARTGSWSAAVGWYHSRTPTLADPYRDRVQAQLTAPVTQRRPDKLQAMATAWAATRGDRAPPPALRVADATLPSPATCAPDEASNAQYDAWGHAALRLDHHCTAP